MRQPRPSGRGCPIPSLVPLSLAGLRHGGGRLSAPQSSGMPVSEGPCLPPDSPSALSGRENHRVKVTPTLAAVSTPCNICYMGSSERSGASVNGSGGLLGPTARRPPAGQNLPLTDETCRRPAPGDAAARPPATITLRRGPDPRGDGASKSGRGEEFLEGRSEGGVE
jgi:hypothetical protein